MFLVTFDAEQSLLRVHFVGTVDAGEMRVCVEQMETALTDVPPGFRLLSDLSGLEVMNPDCAPFIQQAMQLCNGKKIGRIVRVIPDPRKDIGFNLMAVFHYDPSVRISFCDTLAEAESLLELSPSK